MHDAVECRQDLQRVRRIGERQGQRGRYIAKSADEHLLTRSKVCIGRMETRRWIQLVEVIADDQGFRNRSDLLGILVDPFEQWYLADGVLLQVPIGFVTQIDQCFFITKMEVPSVKSEESTDLRNVLRSQDQFRALNEWAKAHAVQPQLILLQRWAFGA